MTRRSDVSERFWTKVLFGAGCWEWQSGKTTLGYGHVKAGGRMWQAHRVAWRLTNGEIPAGLCVLHHCDNRPCVRPDHLFLGTMADNNRDRDLKGRTVVVRVFGPANAAWKERCPCGQAYVTHVDGRRRCRSCNRIRNVAYRARKAGHVA